MTFVDKDGYIDILTRDEGDSLKGQKHGLKDHFNNLSESLTV